MGLTPKESKALELLAQLSCIIAGVALGCPPLGAIEATLVGFLWPKQENTPNNYTAQIESYMQAVVNKAMVDYSVGQMKNEMQEILNVLKDLSTDDPVRAASDLGDIRDGQANDLYTKLTKATTRESAAQMISMLQDLKDEDQRRD